MKADDGWHVRIFGLVMGGAMACQAVPWTDTLAWMECHSGLAGWVQAIGSILALAAAFAVAAWQQKQARDDRVGETIRIGFALALTIRSGIHHLRDYTHERRSLTGIGLSDKAHAEKF